MKEVKPEELRKMIDSGEDMLVLDVLGRDSYRSGHIPNARNIPTSEIESRIADLPQDKKKTIVTYCAGPACSGSLKAAAKLQDLGYVHVLRFTEGLEGWKKAGYELEQHSEE
ncbi:MAG: rhodanese-like domain-containing protein [Candidatus Thermoplasmatota archaeon]|jgi:rhodanese-related sulfurtransferase|nr:rhodanese-like domain-containing protein [Candidatus Thermoplasmatota archaeon]MCL5794003.1 rhodanese-like domain-containing protein [Candidatus Thermoplasmatota archaeon]